MCPQKKFVGEQELVGEHVIREVHERMHQERSAFPFSSLRKIAQHELFETVLYKVGNKWWNIVFHALRHGDWQTAAQYSVRLYPVLKLVMQFLNPIHLYSVAHICQISIGFCSVGMVGLGTLH